MHAQLLTSHERPHARAHAARYLRGKDDPWNSIASGGLTGGVLAARMGPRACAMSAVSGAVILAAIEGLTITINRWSTQQQNPVRPTLPDDPLGPLPAPPPPGQRTQGTLNIPVFLPPAFSLLVPLACHPCYFLTQFGCRRRLLGCLSRSPVPIADTYACASVSALLVLHTNWTAATGMTCSVRLAFRKVRRHAQRPIPAIRTEQRLVIGE